MSIVDIIAGGVKGKPHSTKEGRKAAAKRKVKRWHKLAGQVNQGMRKFSKPEKKKDYVTDPDATFGGRRIKKQGPEIKVSNTQADLSKDIRPKGLGHKAGGRIGLKYGSRGPHGFGPKPFLNRPGQAQGTHGGKMVKASDKAIKGNKLTKKA